MPDHYDQVAIIAGYGVWVSVFTLVDECAFGGGPENRPSER